MSEIKAGDVVCLKSGGPRMTVESVGDYMGDKKADCTWFSGVDRHNNLFHIEALQVIDND